MTINNALPSHVPSTYVAAESIHAGELVPFSTEVVDLCQLPRQPSLGQLYQPLPPRSEAVPLAMPAAENLELAHSTLSGCVGIASQ